MIATATLPDFHQSWASLVDGLPSGDASLAQNDLTSTTASFQSVFAQIADSTPLAQSAQASTKDYSWANTPPQRPTTDSSPTTTKTDTSDDKTKKTLKTTSQGFEHDGPKASAHTVSQRADQGQTNVTRVDSDAGQNLANQPSNGSPTAQSNSNANSSASKRNASGSAPAQTSLQASAINALGGLKSLAGSAFVVHVTPASGSQSGTGQGNGNQQGNESSDSPSQINAAPGLALSSSADPAAFLKTAQAEPSVQISQSLTPVLSAQTNWSAAAAAVPSRDSSSGPSVVSTTVEANEIGSEDPTGVPQTVRTVQVQIAGEGEGRVDLRLVQHGDGLSVSVRSSDSALTKGLQENLPELSARLAADKYQTHAFLPAIGNTNGSSSTASEDHTGQSQDQSNGRSFSQSNTDGRQSGGQSSANQNGQHQQNETAAWWRQMSALGRLSTSTSNPASGEQASTSVNP